MNCLKLTNNVSYEGQLARQIYENKRRHAAALRIQTYYRMHLAKKVFKEAQSSSITIQAGLRGMVARKNLHFKQQTKAVVIIQVKR